MAEPGRPPGPFLSGILSRDGLIDASAAANSRLTSPESIALAKELQKRGWKFFRPHHRFCLYAGHGARFNDHADVCVIPAGKKQLAPEYEFYGHLAINKTTA